MHLCVSFIRLPDEETVWGTFRLPHSSSAAIAVNGGDCRPQPIFCGLLIHIFQHSLRISLYTMARPMRLLTTTRSLTLASRSRPFLIQPVRTLRTTPLRQLATPQTGPQRVLPDAPIRSPNPAETTMATNESPGSHHNAETDPNSGLGMTGYPDYSKGPSALDKASQMFFFTEILRGTSRLSRAGWKS